MGAPGLCSFLLCDLGLVDLPLLAPASIICKLLTLLFASRAEFLNLNTADILGHLVFAVAGCPVLCRTFSSIPRLNPLDASSILLHNFTAKNVSRHVTQGAKSHTYLTPTTALDYVSQLWRPLVTKTPNSPLALSPFAASSNTSRSSLSCLGGNRSQVLEISLENFTWSLGLPARARSPVPPEMASSP